MALQVSEEPLNGSALLSLLVQRLANNPVGEFYSEISDLTRSEASARSCSLLISVRAVSRSRCISAVPWSRISERIRAPRSVAF